MSDSTPPDTASPSTASSETDSLDPAVRNTAATGAVSEVHDAPSRPDGLLGSPDLQLGLIWAQARDRIIGADGDLAWHVPEDLKHFRDTTRGHAVIHGRTSYESLPDAFRPLPGRRNIVLTRQQEYIAPGAEVVSSLEEALALVDGTPTWVCGGGQVYAQAIALADVLVVTDLDLRVAGDTLGPVIGPEWKPSEVSEWLTSVSGVHYRISVYLRQA